MIAVTASSTWHTAHPGAAIGLLEVSGITYPGSYTSLEQRKRETEARLRQRYQGYTRQDFLTLPVMDIYERYYRRFDKTFHVLLQVESIVLKGKSLPSVFPLVDAAFIAEVETLILTAGHDAGKLLAPVSVDVSREGDQLIQMGGAVKTLRAGDMVMRDAQAVSCSILYGQDNRSPITAETTHALYVAYVPAGVPREAVEAQLTGIEANMRLFSPQAVVEQRRVLVAAGG